MAIEIVKFTPFVKNTLYVFILDFYEKRLSEAFQTYALAALDNYLRNSHV
jgi:hypothetical protein